LSSTETSGVVEMMVEPSNIEKGVISRLYRVHKDRERRTRGEWLFGNNSTTSVLETTNRQGGRKIGMGIIDPFRGFSGRCSGYRACQLSD
jgi:hypothetical protein